MKLDSFTPAMSRRMTRMAKEYAETEAKNTDASVNSANKIKQAYFAGASEALQYIKRHSDLEWLITEFPNFMFRKDLWEIEMPLEYNRPKEFVKEPVTVSPKLSFYLHDNVDLAYSDICLSACDLAIPNDRAVGIFLYECWTDRLGEVLECCSYSKSISMMEVLNSPIFAVRMEETSWEYFEKRARMLYDRYGVRDFFIDDFDDMAFEDGEKYSPQSCKELLVKIKTFFSELGANVTIAATFDSDLVRDAKDIKDVYDLPDAGNIADDFRILTEGYLIDQTSLPESAFKHIDAEKIIERCIQRFRQRK